MLCRTHLEHHVRAGATIAPGRIQALTCAASRSCRNKCSGSQQGHRVGQRGKEGGPEEEEEEGALPTEMVTSMQDAAQLLDEVSWPELLP